MIFEDKKDSHSIKSKSYSWFKSGKPWIWIQASSISVSIILILGLFTLILYQGLIYFIPKNVASFEYENSCISGSPSIKRIYAVETRSEDRASNIMRETGYIIDPSIDTITMNFYHFGAREIFSSEFGWICESGIQNLNYPDNIFTVEQFEGGILYATIEQLYIKDKAPLPYSEDNVSQIENELRHALSQVDEVRSRIDSLLINDIGSLNYQIEQLRLDRRRLELDGMIQELDSMDYNAKIAEFNSKYDELNKINQELKAQIEGIGYIDLRLSDETVTRVLLSNVNRIYSPNSLGFFSRVTLFMDKVWEFLSEPPRESNTAGGIFPALFGTVLMVFIMTIMVTPLGVITAIYIHEYSKSNIITRIIRIAINNLAGIPSVVYGIFSLGFFIYYFGSRIDEIFYKEYLPTPVFGTPGLLWASLTLALLTIPVVVVATEEGLARIPRSLKEASLALGANKAETLFKIILPMATPSIMTGIILAIARAAGEVAPLMLVGVVKLAPNLPIDGIPPFIHLDQKIMHLGFYIHDVALQSPNIEASRPLIYAASLLLLLIIMILNFTAVKVRNHLREKYKSLEA